MLYIYHGENTKQAREKAHKALASLKEKRPDAEHFRLDAERFSPAVLEELTQGQGLFERKFVVFCDKLFEDDATKEAFLDMRKEIAASENVFVMLEGKILAADKKKLEKVAERMTECTEKKEVRRKFAMGGGSGLSPEAFNMFAFSDLLAARDKKKLWALFVEARMLGISPEEIHGMLSWQARTMLLANRAKSAEEAGMKPFVYGKAKRAGQVFDEEEISALSARLVHLYHRARRGQEDLELGIEKFILEL